MKSRFSAFVRDETGAVTVDWVVLCAAIVGLTFAALTAIGGGAGGVMNDTVTRINSVNADS